MSKLTYTCTECHFEAKRFSKKTKFSKFFLWFEPQTFRCLWKLLVRLSKPHSICRNDHFVVNQISVKFFCPFWSKGPKIFYFRRFFSAMLSKKHFATPEDHSDMFFLQFSFSTAFEYLSNNFLEFWSKNFGKNCQTAFYVYRRIYRGEIGIWRKNSTFL